MSELPTTPQVGDHFVLVGTMPSGGVWGYPFGDDTWLVRIEKPLLTREEAATDLEVRWTVFQSVEHGATTGNFGGGTVEVTDDE